jgi:AraC-like DNA-binding protein
MYEHRYRENKLHGQPEFPLHIYRVEHPAGTQPILPVHWHNEMEIIYLAHGAAAFQIENRTYALCENEAVLVHPGELHSGIALDGGGVCYYSVVFRLSWLSSPQADRIQAQYLEPILHGTVRLPAQLTHAIAAPAGLLVGIRKLLDAYEHPSAAYELRLKALLLLLIADLYEGDLIEHNPTPEVGPSGETNRQIKQVLAYMEAHSRDKLELNQLAAVASLSRSHFCTFFKNHTGMRPMEYLNYIRINQAASLLRSGSYNVLEAALESGYPHVSYFAKWFKHYMFMTPSAYKARYTSSL